MDDEDVDEEDIEGGTIGLDDNDLGGDKNERDGLGVDKIRDRIKRRRGEINDDDVKVARKRMRNHDSEHWSDSEYEGDVMEDPSEECDEEYYEKIVEYAKSMATPPDKNTWVRWKEIYDNRTFVHED